LSVRINTNIEALNAQRNLSATASVFAKSVEKLSSGLRINRAADDSAGLAISEKLKAQVTGLNQAHRNAQDGVSMVQTAEGALTEVHSMLQRVRELAVEAANSTLSSSDAASVSTEITSLRAEINRIAGATTFNGQYLLTGALSVAQDTAAAGSLLVGTALNTGHTATMAADIDSGAKSNTTYTITSQTGGKVTLSDGAGNSQQVSLAATIGATGTMTVNFGSMGVKLTVVGNSAKTAAELSTDLAAVGGGVVTKSIGGAPFVNLVNGTQLVNPDTTPMVSTMGYLSSGYNPGLGGLDGSSPLTAEPTEGVALGIATITSVDATTGVIHVQAGNEDFVSILPPPLSSTVQSVYLGLAHGSITLTYKTGTGANLTQLASDMVGAKFNFTPGLSAGAGISTMTATPAAAAGTYTFTTSGAGTLTLTGPGSVTQTIAVVAMGPSSSQTLDFATLGISFRVNNGTHGVESETIISNLLQPSMNSIVVTSSGGGGPTNNTVATGAGAGANFQVGANASDSLGVSFADARTTATGYGTLDAAIAAFESATGSGNGIVAAAQALITAVDTAIGYVSTTRGNLGAVQNRLEHTTASIAVASENLNASLSRIRDLDVASEMVNFTKTQILQQAGTAILAQANSAPQGILALLR
jgi:flagellin